LITYIVKSTKNQKRQTQLNGFALFEKMISQPIETLPKWKIHSRYSKIGW